MSNLANEAAWVLRGTLTMDDPRRVTLRRASIAELQAAVAGGTAFAELTGLEAPEGWPEKSAMFEYAISQLLLHPQDAEWWVYLFLDESGQLVGSGGYHGPPVDESVEIGYEIAREFRKHRLGTAAVIELVVKAFDSGDDVQTVIAETEVKTNASVKILKGMGFRCIGTFYDEGYDENQLEWRLDRTRFSDRAHSGG
jgi:[ribosomal protein S5]-alanine N-acetyltransferase